MLRDSHKRFVQIISCTGHPLIWEKSPTFVRNTVLRISIHGCVNVEEHLHLLSLIMERHPVSRSPQPVPSDRDLFKYQHYIIGSPRVWEDRFNLLALRYNIAIIAGACSKAGADQKLDLTAAMSATMMAVFGNSAETVAKLSNIAMTKTAVFIEFKSFNWASLMPPGFQ